MAKILGKNPYKNGKNPYKNGKNPYILYTHLYVHPVRILYG